MKPCGCYCYCPYCSTSLASTAPVVCSRCGDPLHDDYIFCPGCGVEVRDSAVSAPIAQPAQPAPIIGNINASVRFPRPQIVWINRESERLRVTSSDLLRSIVADGLATKPRHIHVPPSTHEAVGLDRSFQLPLDMREAIRAIDASVSFSHHVRSFVAHAMGKGDQP